MFIIMSTAVTLNKVKKGEFFTLKPYEEPKPSQVYVQDGYCRSTRRYDVHKFNDVCFCRELKGTTIVYIDFYF